MGTLALILIPAALFAGAVALVLALRRAGVAAPGRPWWGNPGVWIGLASVSILVGLFVFPRLLGFTFLFIPLIWIRSLRRRPEDDGNR